MAGILAVRHEYRFAFAALAIPALMTLVLLAAARILFPRPEDLESKEVHIQAKGLSHTFWVYLVGAALVAAGFADFPLIAFHFQKGGVLSQSAIPIFYAVAMGAGGASSLVFGRVFDRKGIVILVPLTIVTALYAPLVWFGGMWTALAGVALWGVGMGVHESIIAAAIAHMVGPENRASAYGIFTAGYGVAWFLGSALLGWLYDVSIPALVAVGVALEVLAVPFFLVVARGMSVNSTNSEGAK
jgi:predicted MFS family arabinose efflux permease